MGVDSNLPTSRRGYLSQNELKQFANITIKDSDEADDVISQAEEMIDAFIGIQPKFMGHIIIGKAVGGGSTSLILQSDQQNIYDIDYFKWCEVEIIGGSGIGQRRICTSNTKAGVLSMVTWTTTPDSTSFYKIYQLGKFPRQEDTHFDGVNSPYTYYKSIPENLKRAVAAQVEFIIEMGTNYFAGDKSAKQSESIGDYSYSNAEGGAGLAKLIAPKAKLLLRGLINRTGVIVT